MYEQTRGSILIISHQERILNIADKIVVIKDGQVETEGARAEILPALLGSADAGSPACSVLADKVEGGAQMIDAIEQDLLRGGRRPGRPARGRLQHPRQRPAGAAATPPRNIDIVTKDGQARHRHLHPARSPRTRACTSPSSSAKPA